MMREQSVRESRKLMDDYAKKEIMNEQDFKNKFSKFDQNMEKRMGDYNKFVMAPSLQKEYNLNKIEKKNIEDYNRKREEDENRQNQWRKNQLYNTSNEIRNQMSEKNKMKMLNNELGGIENQMTSDRIYEINNFDQMLKEDKKKRQEMYRQMLNSQVQYNNGLKSFGNMTQVEKKMNKDDLKAYKVYDNNQYGMIPGINNEKKFLKRNSEKPKKQTSFDEQQRRLEAYGYGRYLKKIPTVIPIDSYNGGMAHSRAGNNGIGNMNKSYAGNYPNSLDQNVNNTAVPSSKRHQFDKNSPRSPLRNAGALSMSRQERERGAVSPKIGHPYASQVL